MPAVPQTWLNQFTVSISNANVQDQPDVVQLSDGNILVAWRTTYNGSGAVSGAAGSNLVGRVFTPDGTPLTDEIALGHFNDGGDEGSPHLLALPTGGFVVAYESNALDASSHVSLYVERYDSEYNYVNGQTVFDYTGSGSSLVSNFNIALSSSGAILATYSVFSNASGWIQAVVVDADGNLVESYSFANGSAIGDVDLIATADGHFLVAFQRQFSDEILYSYISPSGISVSEPPVAISNSPGDQLDFEPSIAALPDNRVALAFVSGGTVWVQVFDPTGGTTAAVNVAEAGMAALDHPSVTTLADGSFVVAYEVNDGTPSGAAVTHFSADGVKLGTYQFASGAVDEPTAFALADGRFAIATYDQNANISLEILDTRDTVSGPAYFGPGHTYQAGTAGNDVFTAHVADYLVYGGAGNDTITETYGANTYGGAGDDTLIVTDKVDEAYTELHDGGAGRDTIDWSGVDQGGLVFDLTNGVVRTSGGVINVMTNFERVIGTANGDVMLAAASGSELLGGGGSDDLRGSTGDDVLYGGAGGDILNGVSGGTDTASYKFDGAVTLNFATGVHTGAAAGDTFIDIEHFELSANNDTFIGSANDDYVFGGAGNDILDGRGGLDTLIGQAGDDSYYLDGLLDEVLEQEGEGTDTVYVSFTYSLAAATEIEVLRTTNASGTAALKLYGNEYNNRIIANAGNNTLDGGAGGDRLEGGAGNDSYFVDNAGDLVIEAVGNGTDTVNATVSFSLAGQYIENLRLLGTGLINGTGNGSDNVIDGNGQANVINGGAGGDTMRGGGGDDVYYVDDVNDKVIENANQGSDTVNSSVSFSLAGQYAEALNLTGTAAINGSGNGLNNRIIGNSAANALNGGDGNDRLDGGAGADKLTGGLGNDTYVVDNAGDVINELDGQGTDTVESSITYSLAGRYIEMLKLTGTANINATGNGLANTLVGNSGNNTLNGGAGADKMTGGTGNDRYVIDNVGDTIVELNNEGLDTVESSITFTLAGQYLEDLVLTGTAAINGTGNGLANVLTGNGAANTLNGGTGDDALHGGLGKDVLTGGGGIDHFWFETTLGAANVDKITDFNVVDDTIDLDRSIFSGIAANGVLASGAFRLGTAAVDADDRILYDKATGNLYYDADGVGGTAAVLFAQVNANTNLTAADFFGHP